MSLFILILGLYSTLVCKKITGIIEILISCKIMKIAHLVRISS